MTENMIRENPTNSPQTAPGRYLPIYMLEEESFFSYPPSGRVRMSLQYGFLIRRNDSACKVQQYRDTDDGLRKAEVAYISPMTMVRYLTALPTKSEVFGAEENTTPIEPEEVPKHRQRRPPEPKEPKEDKKGDFTVLANAIMGKKEPNRSQIGAQKEPEEDKEPKRPPFRGKIFGQSVGAVLRWLGTEGVSEAEARLALEAHDCGATAGATIAIHLKHGVRGERAWKHSSIAFWPDLTKAQKTAILAAARGENPVKKPKRK